MTAQTSIDTAVPIPIDKGGTGQTTQAAASEALLGGASLTTATVATGDKVLIQDTSNSNVLRTVTAQSIADLGGAFKALETITVTEDTGSVTFTGLNTVTAYAIYIDNAVPVDNSTLSARFGSSSGINSTAGYDYGYSIIQTNQSLPNNSSSTSQTSIRLGGQNTSGPNGGASGWFYFNGNAIPATNTRTSCSAQIYTTRAARSVAELGLMAALGPPLILDRVQVFFNTQDIESGTFTLYEIAGA